MAWRALAFSLTAPAVLVIVDASLLRGSTRREILFPTSTNQGTASGRWMCTPASREARCGQTSGSPLTKVGARNSFRPADVEGDFLGAEGGADAPSRGPSPRC